MREWLNAKIMGNEDEPAGCRHGPLGSAAAQQTPATNTQSTTPAKAKTSTTTHKSTVAAKPKPLAL